MLEKKTAEMGTVSDKHKKVSATSEGTLTVRDQVVHAYATAGADVVITLPNVSEAIGLLFAIHCVNLTAPQTITVQDNDESLGWSDMVFTADNDCALLYSDGFKWWKVVDVTT